MACCSSCQMQESLPAPDAWRGRALTGRAMILLAAARVAVALLPFRLWRGRLGLGGGEAARSDTCAARRLARQVERGAWRLPIATKCLHRAMALSWLLRRKGVRHAVVFAVRPPELRDGEDALHAWVEAGGECLIGELPGAWMVTARLGE